MKRTVVSIGLLALSAQPIRAQSSAPIDRLAYLAGCWELRAGDRTGHEQWMTPASGMMLGMSRTMIGGVVRSWEYARIEVKDGVITYSAQPGGVPATAFPATSITDSVATFDQPGHDFPQRIIYRRVGSDSLVARIEGTINGESRGIDFPMRRISCPAGGS